MCTQLSTGQAETFATIFLIKKASIVNNYSIKIKPTAASRSMGPFLTNEKSPHH